MAWDDEEEEFEPTATGAGRWDDEEEEAMFESWEAADSDTERKKAAAQQAAMPKKKTLKEKIAEREAAQEIEDEKQRQIEAEKNETPRERRERLKKAQLEADLKNAEDLFGGLSVGGEGQKDDAETGVTFKRETLEKAPSRTKVAMEDSDSDNESESESDSEEEQDSKQKSESKPREVKLADLPLFQPRTKQDFDKLREELIPLLTAYAKKPQYASNFAPEFIRDLVRPLSAEDARNCSSRLNALINEKQRDARAAAKKGAGRKKPNLANGSIKKDDERDTTNYSAYDDDFDDFM